MNLPSFMYTVKPVAPRCSVPGSVTVGTSTELRCLENEGFPAPQYRWFQNNEELPQDPKTSLKFANSSYIINPDTGGLVRKTQTSLFCFCLVSYFMPLDIANACVHQSIQRSSEEIKHHGNSSIPCMLESTFCSLAYRKCLDLIQNSSNWFLMHKGILSFILEQETSLFFNLWHLVCFKTVNYEMSNTQFMCQQCQRALASFPATI